VKKAIWSVFIVLAGFVLAQLVDTVTAPQIVRIITGAIVKKPKPIFDYTHFS
jgi:hypothetical protein